MKGIEMAETEIDYPVAAPAGIEPIFYRQTIIQSMALQYFNYMRDAPEEFTMSEAFEAAHATWETDWPDDPAPRTMEAAREVVDDDLAYWNEE
jgi:hypothetical protein